MAMLIPVAGLVVNLDIANPQRTAYFHLGIEEVRTAITVVQARVYHLHLLSVSGLQTTYRPHLMLPAVVK